MPYFYIRVQNQNERLEDIDGEEFPTLEDAKQYALLGARDIMSDRIGQGRDPYQGSMVISDGDGQILMVIPFRDAITDP